jgi:SOS-response transcriptional repressor LexA
MKKLNERLMSLCSSKTELARIAGVGKQSVTNWVSRNSISKKGAERIAAHFNVSLEWVLSGTAVVYNRENPTYAANTLKTIRPSRMIPLISWVQAGSWTEIMDLFQCEDTNEYYPCPENHSEKTFALTIVGESMSPDFIPGEIIYVDPCVEATSGACVVIRQNGDTEATFKQLMLDGSKKYLKALNPSWPNPIMVMLHDAVICGVVIGSYRKRT